METTNFAAAENNSQDAVVPQYVTDLKAAFELAIVSPDFIDNKKKVEAAIKALAVPNAEARVIAQLKTHAEKSLYAKAAMCALKNNTMVVAPTQEAINAKVAEGLAAWKAKQQ